MTEINLVLLGPPGPGKGTQAKALAADRALAYIATGDLLRAAVAKGSPTGRRAKAHVDAGELVPDTLVFDVVMDALRREAVTSGFVLDGFPRTIPQADALDVELARRGRPLPAAIVLDASDDVLIERLSGRRICSAHGHEYHLDFRPPIRAGVCDIDGSPLVRRGDDEPATIRRRLTVYHDRTEPLLAHYESQQRLRRVAGEGDLSETRERLAAAVSTLSDPRP